MRMFQHTPATLPARVRLSIGVAEVAVHAEDRPDITVTLASTSSTDTVAEDLIGRAESTVTAGAFTVTVPRPTGGHGSGATTVIRTGGSVTISSRTIGHGNVVIGNSDGITVINGQVVGGPGVTVINGQTGGALRATVRVPRNAAVVVRTDMADVTTHGDLTSLDYRSQTGDLMADSAASLVATTMSGDITAGLVTTAEVHSTSGDVTIDQATDAILDTVSGDVRVHGLRGCLNGRSVSGDITAHATAESQIHAQSVSGDVRVTHAPGVQVSTRLASVSGRVRGARPGA